ncbi:MAG: hypothetical protein K9H26_07610 [Prolixibacteraceae bacterium]|nr:hypothetical protein [Prolixibacteraceae bacterium]
MELKLNIDYYQILGLIRQLPEKEKKKLSDTLKSEILSGKSTKSIRELILKAPTWSDMDYDAFRESRNYINKSRIA